MKAHGFLQSCLQDSGTIELQLIAEPWDIGPAATSRPLPRLAGPNGNDNSATRYALTGGAMRASRPRWRHGLAASANEFATAAARPGPSVNFITAMTAFTLNDLVSYNEKHNEAKRENGRDGHSENFFL